MALGLCAKGCWEDRTAEAGRTPRTARLKPTPGRAPFPLRDHPAPGLHGGLRRQELRTLTANSPRRTPSSEQRGRAGAEPHQHLRPLPAPVPGKAWLQKYPQPPLKLPYFYVKKNTCLEAMPTLSVWGKWVPSLTQGQNYAWQPAPTAQQAGLDTIPSAGMGGGGCDPKGSCQEVVRSQSSSLCP